MPVIPHDALESLNNQVYERGSVDREHLLQFLSLIPTSDAQAVVREVRSWLQQLHNDPKYDKVRFTPDDIDAIINDLDSYGRIQASTLYKLQEPQA